VWVLALRAFQQFRRLAATIDAAIERRFESSIEGSAAEAPGDEHS
jgi:hypothetical protein